MTTSPFLRPNDTSTGGAGGGGAAISNGGSGRVSIQDTPRARAFPWPLPFSATQGAVGGAGGVGKVMVSAPPYYGPFNYYWPHGIPQQLFNGLPTNPLRM